MANRTNYFKVGLFTLVSLMLTIIFFIMLGIGSMFKSSVLVETYFNESVQGLNIGSPVKYRGVTIGKVTKIQMLNEVYGQQTNQNQEERYIYVEFSITQRLDTAKMAKKDAEKTIQDYVDKGLRTSLATQDFVGNVYLSLNFFEDIDKASALPLSWRPKNIYIPSTPSKLSQLADTVTNITNNLQHIDFKKAIHDIDVLAVTLDDSIKSAKINDLSHKLNTTLDQTSQAIQQMDGLSSKINIFISAQQQNWENTFDTLHQASLNLASLSNRLKNNPSDAIFGPPTQPMDPSK